ncbi:MAG: hypothetical protein LBS87_02625 [Puniceicoccales bacterium]|nr:hypothetical protein [Puniceicoccales bacterium]
MRTASPHIHSGRLAAGWRYFFPHHSSGHHAPMMARETCSPQGYLATGMAINFGVVVDDSGNVVLTSTTSLDARLLVAGFSNT